ncbi:branched-chain amino acid ABC transporter permease [Azospirillum picis]|uniref:Branched-chain amino acid transport system permease protein n=1 Tax=Azospirillum picis TaxID=488438 RepID=A0ABU0MNG7_9PROT|nr:branched-chain amino acid ABC transporter permease [Azospirillum picis]MBP2301164.1 branched-chain amino acid transport system permease protein [Azospirillum picis]MDQ0534874.1 branched-chain amino acid transport system permease protein [Azospirillum picis]
MRAALTRLAAPALLFLLLLAVPFLGIGGGFVLDLLTRAMILGIAAVSLSLLVGGAGLVSLGHAAMMGIGAYAVAALDAAGITEGMIVFPTALAAAALFALVTGAVSLRTSGVHFIMITLAFGQMAFFTASSFSSLGGDDGYTLYARTEILGSPLLQDRRSFYLVCLALLALVWGGCTAILGSRFGRVLRAARENERRVRAVGFSPVPYRLVAYVMAGAVGGLAGALLANASEFVSPASLSWTRSGELLFLVILGGLGRLHGAILGALAFVLLEEWLSHLFVYWRLVFGPLLVLAVLFLHDGIAGLPGSLRAWSRWRPTFSKRRSADA